MKKLLAVLLALVLAFSLVACSAPATTEPEAEGDEQAPAEKQTIAILAPNPTHDWTGSVGFAAEAKAEEINAAGVYDATVLSSPDSATQISQIDDIVANKQYDAVVILPMDNTVEASLTNLVNSGIPVVQFDRLIASLEDSVVANVMGDNSAIGYETALRFVENGLEKTDKILLLQGDLSSVPGMRTDGFKSGLMDSGWTEEEINAAIVDLGSTGWQRSEGERLFTDWLNGASDEDIASTTWVFTHDDPIAMGIFDALSKTAIEDAKKDAFLGSEPRINLASSAGAAENYTVLAGNHKDPAYNEIYTKLADYFSVTYSPYMMEDAIQVMVDHLDGKAIEKVTVIPAEVVDASNVANFTGFGEE